MIVHELPHLGVQTHGRSLKALMTAQVPTWRQFEIELSEIAGIKRDVTALKWLVGVNFAATIAVLVKLLV